MPGWDDACIHSREVTICLYANMAMYLNINPSRKIKQSLCRVQLFSYCWHGCDEITATGCNLKNADVCSECWHERVAWVEDTGQSCCRIGLACTDMQP